MKIPKGMEKLIWPDDKKRQVLAMCGHYPLAEIAKHVGKTETQTLECIRRMRASIKMIKTDTVVTTYDK